MENISPPTKFTKLLLLLVGSTIRGGRAKLGLNGSFVSQREEADAREGNSNLILNADLKPKVFLPGHSEHCLFVCLFVDQEKNIPRSCVEPPQ